MFNDPDHTLNFQLGTLNRKAAVSREDEKLVKEERGLR
jgi:hypothetical protein